MPQTIGTACACVFFGLTAGSVSAALTCKHPPVGMFCVVVSVALLLIILFGGIGRL